MAFCGGHAPERRHDTVFEVARIGNPPGVACHRFWLGHPLPINNRRYHHCPQAP